MGTLEVNMSAQPEQPKKQKGLTGLAIPAVFKKVSSGANVLILKADE